MGYYGMLYWVIIKSIIKCLSRPYKRETCIGISQRTNLDFYHTKVIKSIEISKFFVAAMAKKRRLLL